ncbi:HCNGP-like protein, putative [Plasmodium knowlesi strain H]|uniref:HCNGP-like protein, putative n=3 Tax=Plasmodium knowlesi TaxID=5850 RepID=A0A5K1VRW8_PLAKH|nr:HCNGP-like protein, putative [Plasmodium knowlesi strain H]OTN67210.1 putative HCNGP-like protein [Plasmodium knowlesi]CAA9988822.1 HCNGP-like protein, putative [Plasmodium knowlesi strain H]SBO21831.1 HCNGP-like protein, putative [Plasmodium knowlesi strain H]SBO22200.1 HCNGP-like protein, putative [Plasmodium knowlesi strain H]VVS78296.1 HCNGP-like protein, putative [Plasmodium knowlesi strain H]|eukprot:XP_002259801.1 HCNGP-like protein, putative [Plasmodium knowlesi strain H]
MNLVDYELSSDDERGEAPPKREVEHENLAQGGNKCTEKKKNREKGRDNKANKNENDDLDENETDNGCLKKKTHIHLGQKWNADREVISMENKTLDAHEMCKDVIAGGKKEPSGAPLLSKLNGDEKNSHYDGCRDDNHNCNDGRDTEVRPVEQDKKEQNKQRNVPLVGEQTDYPIAKGANLLESNNLINISVNENNFDELFFLPPNEYSDCLNQKIEELSKLYKINLTINKNIINSNEYKNPCILQKIMEIFQIDVYSSNYPLNIYNPDDFLSIDLFNEKGEETDQKKPKTKWSNH